MDTQGGPSRELPRYQCYKTVHALKIANVLPDVTNRAITEGDRAVGATLHFGDLAYGPIHVDAAYVAKHDPQPGGYYVVYEDGYRSFSPATAFERGYQRLSGASSEDRILREVFSYHAPTPEQIPEYEAIRAAARDFALLLLDHTPRCADQTAAIRKLRECVMTANAAIALRGLI
jgi:hypothetical protein